jgi:hypothetical protein
LGPLPALGALLFAIFLSQTVLLYSQKKKKKGGREGWKKEGEKRYRTFPSPKKVSSCSFSSKSSENNQ